ncbi:integrase core domain-containing protein [Dyadobacter psychrophilus]|uniref:integrase core domain-containing protein n=1 Tax=Dyadobacter psychrophilus TaxID=651661 RepID=UPI0009E36FF0|nr:integrase core domain-containing protein [Dyadobacter psychrophilus]
MDYSIKFRPIKPRSAHLIGKVERSRQTDLQEFYSTVDRCDPDLDDKLAQWQFRYNYFHPQSSLGGKTPIEFATRHCAKAPF